MARKPTTRPAGKPKPASIAGTLTKADIPQLAGGKGANKPQMASPTYRLAALDQEYLLSDSMRGVRFMLEYDKAEEALDRWGVRSTIVVFGSARFSEKGPPDHRRWYSEARAFARIVSEKGGAKLQNGGQRDNVIATGGGPGIMEAANRGAHDVGAPSIGYNITLPMEQEPNAFSTPDLTLRFHYFAMRKMHFLIRSVALVCFPGGFGTLDELFEVMTLQQTGKIRRRPILLFGRAFWERLIDFEHLVETGMIAPADRQLFHFVETAEQAWHLLAAEYGIGNGNGNGTATAD